MQREGVTRTRPSFRFDFRVLHFFQKKRKKKPGAREKGAEALLVLQYIIFKFTTKKLLFDVRAKAKAKAKL